ncbi:MAG: hypothetical protein FWD15_01430 [Alphaproteobacteria bacterium]|nr:hypothetical protein [Alphaproteobacteria bacterium]
MTVMEQEAIELFDDVLRYASWEKRISLPHRDDKNLLYRLFIADALGKSKPHAPRALRAEYDLVIMRSGAIYRVATPLHTLEASPELSEAMYDKTLAIFSHGAKGKTLYGDKAKIEEEWKTNTMAFAEKYKAVAVKNY